MMKNYLKCHGLKGKLAACSKEGNFLGKTNRNRNFHLERLGFSGGGCIQLHIE